MQTLAVAGTAERVEFTRTDYAGRLYGDFHARRSASDGPGWYVYGRCPHAYGGRLVNVCARPAVQPRKHPHYNGPIRRGFRTLREAAAVAAALNAAAALAGTERAPSIQYRDASAIRNVMAACSMGKAGSLGVLPWIDAGYCLDAPDVIPCGSTHRYERAGDTLAMQRSTFR